MDDDFWSIEEAEQNFGKVLHRALTNVSQTVITPDGQAVVVLNERDHRLLILCMQRLDELGEPLPVLPPPPKEGQMSAWEFIQGLAPVKQLRAAGLPDDALARAIEESRAEHRRGVPASTDSSANAAD